LTTVYYGESFVNIFKNNAALAGCNIKTLYVPAGSFDENGDISVNHKYFGWNDRDSKFTKGGVIYYTGTKSQAEKIINTERALYQANYNNAADYNTAVWWVINLVNTDEYNALTDEEKANNCYMVYDYNKCDAFYSGKHYEDNNPCVINCNRCEAKGVAEKDPVHNIVTSLTYVSFIEKGIKVVGCTNESCAYGSTEEKDALFTYSGESTPEFAERDAIAIGFNVNIAAIIEYEAITGNSVSYGVFAVSKDRIGNNPIFDANGKAADGVISACVGSRNSVSFTLKIIGFSNTQYHDSRFAMGAYVADNNGESTEYSYLQGGEPAEGESYYFISYNDIVNAQ
jgi:hypothetical protein